MLEYFFFVQEHATTLCETQKNLYKVPYSFWFQEIFTDWAAEQDWQSTPQTTRPISPFHSTFSVFKLQVQLMSAETFSYLQKIPQSEWEYITQDGNCHLMLKLVFSEGLISLSEPSLGALHRHCVLKADNLAVAQGQAWRVFSVWRQYLSLNMQLLCRWSVQKAKHLSFTDLGSDVKEGKLFFSFLWFQRWNFTTKSLHKTWNAPLCPLDNTIICMFLQNETSSIIFQNYNNNRRYHWQLKEVALKVIAQSS